MSTKERWRAWRAENARKAPLSDAMEERLGLRPRAEHSQACHDHRVRAAIARIPLRDARTGCPACGTGREDLMRDMLVLMIYPTVATVILAAGAAIAARA